MFYKKKSHCNFCTAFLWIFHILAVLAIGASLAYAYSDKMRGATKKLKSAAADCIDSCCDAMENICE